MRPVGAPRGHCDRTRIRLRLLRDAVLTACLAAFVVAWCSSRALAGACPLSEWSFTTAFGWQTTAAAVFDTSANMAGPIGGTRVTIDIPGGQVGVYRCCDIGSTATRLVVLA